MEKSKLSDDEWVKLITHLKKIVGIRVGCEARCHRFVEAVLWILRGGAQWRLLPDRLGHWNSVFKRFARWSRCGVWEQIFEGLSHQADFRMFVHGQHRDTCARLCRRCYEESRSG
jgi:transposase